MSKTFNSNIDAPLIVPEGAEATARTLNEAVSVKIQPIPYQSTRTDGPLTYYELFPDNDQINFQQTITRLPRQCAQNSAVQDSENRNDSSKLPEDQAEKPLQMMTPFGPIPLPNYIRDQIPVRFEGKPIIKERNVYVNKKEVQERVIEVPHVQYEHRFLEIPHKFVIEKLVPLHKETVKEVGREVYKPVIEEKVIEVPQGVKYVEVPVEVPCIFPPKIVPVPKIQYVERIVETIKPVIKQRIVEVPQHVVKEVEKVKIVEVPYYVPKYVEKIVECPFSPPDSGVYQGESLPFAISSVIPNPNAGPAYPSFPFPPSFAGSPMPCDPTIKLGPFPVSQINDIHIPYEARIDVRVTRPEFAHTIPGLEYLNAHQYDPLKKSLGLLGNISKVNGINLPHGYHWGSPGLAKLSTEHGTPFMVTCPPQVGEVKFVTGQVKPNILTRQGILPLNKFSDCIDPSALIQ